MIQINLTFCHHQSNYSILKLSMPPEKCGCMCAYLDLDAQRRCVCWLVEDWICQVGQTQSTATVDVHHLVTTPGWQTNKKVLCQISTPNMYSRLFQLFV